MVIVAQLSQSFPRTIKAQIIQMRRQARGTHGFGNIAQSNLPKYLSSNVQKNNADLLLVHS